MCRFKSGIILKTRSVVAPGRNDSHSLLLESLGIEDTEANAMTKFVRAELEPLDGDEWTDPDTWNMRVDQDIVPDWFKLDPGKYEKEFHDAVKEWWNGHVLINKEIDFLDSGYYRLKRCKVKELRNNVEVDLFDSRVGIMKDSSVVGNMSNGSVIHSMEDRSSINTMIGGCEVGMMKGHSSIGEILGHSYVGDMYGYSLIDFMTNSRVDCMKNYSSIISVEGNSLIGSMFNYSSINELTNYSLVNEMYHNSKIGRMRGDSLVFSMYGSSVIDEMEECSMVKNMVEDSEILIESQNSVVVNDSRRRLKNED